MRRWRPLIELGFFLLVLAGLFLTSRDRFFFDPGTFWHTRTGEELLRRGFLKTDPFTYTQAGRTWIPAQWLAEMGMAVVHERMGLDGLLWTALLLLAGLFAWLAGRFTQAGCHPLLTAVFLGLVFGASCYHYHARPHLFTLVFLGLLLGLLADVESGRASLWRLLWLVPFFILWVNLHGGVLGGMATFGLAGFGWGVNFLLKKPSPLKDWRDVLSLALIGGFCAATVLVNPYGLGLIDIWREILRQDLPNIIAEHKPLSLEDPEGWAVLLLGALYVFFLAGASGWPRVVWLLPLVWLAQAWLRVRNGPLFAVTAAVALADLLPHCRWMLALGRRSDLYVVPDGDGPKPRWRLLAHPWLFLLPIPFLAPAFFRGGVQLDAQHWPLALLPQLRSELRQPGAVIFNDDLYGGFLVYFVPETKIFIDDRCELHGRDLLLEYVAAVRGEPPQTAEAMAGWIRKHKLTLALTKAEGPFAKYLKGRPDWKLLAETEGPPEKRVALFKRLTAADSPKTGEMLIVGR